MFIIKFYVYTELWSMGISAAYEQNPGQLAFISILAYLVLVIWLPIFPNNDKKIDNGG